MATIYDVFPNDLIEKAAMKLKEMDKIESPHWALFAKTGAHKERPPVSEDWWYYRAAAVLRKVYKMGPIGVSKLRTYYGGRKNRGNQPDKFVRGSGSVIRKVLQQLQAAELIEYKDKGLHKGRIITGKGMSFLDKIASEIYKEDKKSRVEVKEVKVEKKEEPKVKKKVEVKTEKKVEVKKEEPKVEVKKAEPVKVEVKTEKKVEVKKEEPKVEVKKAEPVKEEVKTEKKEEHKVEKKEEVKIEKKEEPKVEEKKAEPVKEEAKPETKVEVKKEEPKENVNA